MHIERMLADIMVALGCTTISLSLCLSIKCNQPNGIPATSNLVYAEHAPCRVWSKIIWELFHAF